MPQPMAHGVRLPKDVGSISLKVPEFPNEAWAYVPDGYAADVPYGVVIWLHGPGGFDWPQLMARWKPLCQRHDLILVAPKSADAARWTSGEAALVPRLLVEVAAKYNVDPARVVVHGYESGGSLAFAAALRNIEAIRAVAVVEAAPQGEVPENDPVRRLAVYVAVASKSTAARPVDLSAAAFREKGIPVTMKSPGDVARYLDDDELARVGPLDRYARPNLARILSNPAEHKTHAATNSGHFRGCLAAWGVGNSVVGGQAKSWHWPAVGVAGRYWPPPGWPSTTCSVCPTGW